jgi:hypothetical protein
MRGTPLHRFCTVPLSLLIGLAVTSSCASAQIDQKLKKVDGSRWFAGSYEVSCDRTGSEGTVIFTVFSTEKKEEIALREARRNAVRALVFRGLSTERCREVPMIRLDEFTEKADQYFDGFFKEGGPYLSYVEYAGDEVESRTKVGKQVKIGSTVVVQRTRLRQDLEKAGIVKSMSDVFKRD